MARFKRIYRRRRRFNRRVKKYRRKKFNRKMSNMVYIKLRTTTLISSDGAGNIGVVTGGIMTAQQVTGAGNYSALANIYDQFEVHAMKYELFAYRVGAESATIPPVSRGNLASIVDMDGSTLPTSILSAAEYATFKNHQPRNNIKRYVVIPKKHRPELNDFAVGYSTDNDNVTIYFIGDSWSNNSTAFYAVKTWYVKCYGTR